MHISTINGCNIHVAVYVALTSCSDRTAVAYVTVLRFKIKKILLVYIHEGH